MDVVNVDVFISDCDIRGVCAAGDLCVRLTSQYGNPRGMRRVRCVWFLSDGCLAFYVPYKAEFLLCGKKLEMLSSSVENFVMLEPEDIVREVGSQAAVTLASRWKQLVRYLDEADAVALALVDQRAVSFLSEAARATFAREFVMLHECGGML